MEFAYDTGSDVMLIYTEDIRTIMGPYGPHNGFQYPQCLGVGRGETAGGPTEQKYFGIEVTILDPNGVRMMPWVGVYAATHSNRVLPGSVPRIDGPLVRSMLYMGSAPEGNQQMYLAPTKATLTRALPTINLTNAHKQPPIPQIFAPRVIDHTPDHQEQLEPYGPPIKIQPWTYKHI